MEKRYRALRFIGSVYRIFGIVLAVLTALGALGICLGFILGTALFQNYLQQVGMQGTWGGIIFGIVGGLVFLIFGGTVALGLYAAGEFFHLLVSVEENTRNSALALVHKVT